MIQRHARRKLFQNHKRSSSNNSSNNDNSHVVSTVKHRWKKYALFVCLCIVVTGMLNASIRSVTIPLDATPLRSTPADRASLNQSAHAAKNNFLVACRGDIERLCPSSSSTASPSGRHPSNGHRQESAVEDGNSNGTVLQNQSANLGDVINCLRSQRPKSKLAASCRDAMKPPRPHPFGGAVDAAGNWGYVHNPKVLLNAATQSDGVSTSPDGPKPSRAVVCASPGRGHEGMEGYQALQKIRDQLSTPARTRATQDGASHRIRNHSIIRSAARIMCIVYTYHGTRERLEAIRNTWAPKCDGFLASSTFTDPSTGTVYIPHKGKQGSYDSIWQKVTSTLVYVHSNFLDDYSHFHVCGDDTYVVVDNLRAFVNGIGLDAHAHDDTMPLYLGGWIRPTWRNPKSLPSPEFYYNGGGPGYTLNRAALALFVDKSLQAETARCPHDKVHSAEDLFMGKCLWHENVFGYDTRNRNGQSRYHHYDPKTLAQHTTASFADNTTDFSWIEQLRWIQSIPVGTAPHVAGMIVEAVDTGSAAPQSITSTIAPDSIAFHLIKDPDYMHRIHAILYPGDSSHCT